MPADGAEVMPRATGRCAIRFPSTGLRSSSAPWCPARPISIGPLQLIQAAAAGTLSYELAGEGGWIRPTGRSAGRKIRCASPSVPSSPHRAAAQLRL